MKPDKGNLITSADVIFPVAALFAIVALLWATQASSAQTQDGRPRRTGQTMTVKPSPTPTPVVQRSPNQAPATRAATPTPTPASVDKTAPKLGDAPPPPRLKPKP